MKKATLYTLLLLLVFIAPSCKQKVSQKEAIEIKPEVTPAFTLPEIPALLTDPESRALFFALHYWDHFPFSDVTYTDLPETTEQALVDFIDLLKHVPQEQIMPAFQALLQKASVEPKMIEYFWRTINRYLYDPNSPLLNEAYYLLACKAAVELKEIMPPAIFMKAEYNITQLTKNQVGTIATNLTFTTPAGDKKKLFDIKALYTILYFYNPGCQTCDELKHYMENSEILNEALDKKQLQIVGIYPDEDVEEWRTNLSAISKRWITGYDPEQLINKKQLYYLRAIPTFYLLDKEKKVLLKDAPIQEIVRFLENKSL